MKPWALVRLLFLWPAFAGWCAPALFATTPVPGDPLSGNGVVNRSVLTYSQLFSNTAPAAPVDDSGGFGLPANAAAPAQAFEGTLTLSAPTTSGSSQILRNDFGYDTASNSPWRHLASFSFQFVQNGSYLIPVQQGLVITGSTAWNYIVGPGRVWQETSDNGYMRASFPFALVERNQNCVHNGEMTFLFNRTKSPNISQVRYQVTQETCLYFKLNMWGQLAATYTPGSVANNEAPKWQTAYPPSLSALWRRTTRIPGSILPTSRRGSSRPLTLPLMGCLSMASTTSAVARRATAPTLSVTTSVCPLTRPPSRRLPDWR